MVVDALDVAFVVPSSGPSGIYGPSCWASGRLAVSEINDDGGILGREVRLCAVDGGRAPQAVAAEVGSLVASGAVGAVAGWHTSAVRQAVAPRLEGRVAYVYTALYEGGECTPGVFLTGETPAGQLLPALGWMARELGVRSWCIVGNDYVWPRASARVARTFAASVGAEVCDEIYVGLGTEEFGPTLRRVERSRAQGVLMFLLGSDAVRFNRAFTEMRLHDQRVRLSPLMDENMLLATGAANTHDLYSAAGFFEALGTPHGLDFERRYLDRLGPTAPAITSPGESCFEGMTLLAHLAAAARSTEVAPISAAAESVSYEGPRGAVRVHDRHLMQRIYLARADGLEFDVLAEISGGL
ncbi:substrate-binding domain-containing protein [Pseudonocardia petroleophila]|uniref:Substrate-binding domain-containing protein n=1 Tax=Pseudonocardia petroleophila TaxID=37331 RepID=A0A7G7MFK6_9PSEU|nr:substrate-binding domain-containing protein [Pseudonocardia petroleophila]QNG51567.1 substrate-binding domain-containing protein [Pseudonocardia petroleophila]